MEDNNEVHADKFLEAQKPLVGMKNQKIEEPWDEVFRGKPDLIASGRSDRAAVLLKMSRQHANVLGAYLNGRNDIAPLPDPIAEILDALTLRLVSPNGARWADLRRVLDGQPAVQLPSREEWHQESLRQARDADAAGTYDHTRNTHGRHRQPYTGDLSDLRADLRPAEIGDADGTTMAEWPEEQR